MCSPISPSVVVVGPIVWADGILYVLCTPQLSLFCPCRSQGDVVVVNKEAQRKATHNEGILWFFWVTFQMQ